MVWRYEVYISIIKVLDGLKLKMEFDNLTWSSYKTSGDLLSNEITAIAVDASGNKWFATQNYGLSKFDDTIGQLTQYQTA